MKILTINSGSSSLKFSAWSMDAASSTELARGTVSAIRAAQGAFHAMELGGAETKEERPFPDHESALEAISSWLGARGALAPPDAIGHRVVHGGLCHGAPALITQGLIGELRALSAFAPNHLPHEILSIEALARAFPHTPQVACFDTAFHAAMPVVARTYALPKHLREPGLVKYGFHGLSYEHILGELRAAGEAQEWRSRVIIAHLGHGSSMAAVKDATCIDTTMGFTPCGGLVMSTRTGDLDPGVLLYLMTEKKMGVAEISELVYRRSGLLGLSGASPEMEELLALARTSKEAQEAVSVYCYSAKKHLGSLAAALNGLDTLVFTGGIGENSPEVRRRICFGLEFLGVEMDDVANEANSPMISREDTRVKVRVIKTDEERVIARHAHEVASARHAP